MKVVTAVSLSFWKLWPNVRKVHLCSGRFSGILIFWAWLTTGIAGPIHFGDAKTNASNSLPKSKKTVRVLLKPWRLRLRGSLVERRNTTPMTFKNHPVSRWVVLGRPHGPLHTLHGEAIAGLTGTARNHLAWPIEGPILSRWWVDFEHGAIIRNRAACRRVLHYYDILLISRAVECKRREPSLEGAPHNRCHQDQVCVCVSRPRVVTIGGWVLFRSSRFTVGTLFLWVFIICFTTSTAFLQNVVVCGTLQQQQSISKFGAEWRPEPKFGGQNESTLPTSQSIPPRKFGQRQTLQVDAFWSTAYKPFNSHSHSRGFCFFWNTDSEVVLLHAARLHVCSDHEGNWTHARCQVRVDSPLITLSCVGV